MTADSETERFDVVVVGATPGGIAAAISAARLGCSVALTEYHPHLGGMTASGLGKSDIDNREAIGGLFLEFVGRVRKHYLELYGPDSENVARCRDGYYFEPSVAEKVFNEMTREAGVDIFANHRLQEVVRSGRGVEAVRLVDRTNDKEIELRGNRFIDGTYEGDLAGWAGVPFRVGRESRADYDELHAGVVYQDHRTHTFLQGTTGTGDDLLQAYTYRLCFTDDPENARVLKTPPPDYDRTRYLQYFDDLEQGRLDAPEVIAPENGDYPLIMGTLVRAFSMAELPNRKLDINMNPRPLGFPFCQENSGYVEADWQERERIAARIRNIALGLLYFLQNDPQVSEEHRELANRFHLAADEFVDNGNFPWQLYIREARRIWGEYTLSENDVVPTDTTPRPPIHWDSVVAGEFPIDSFPVKKREEGRQGLEGYLCVMVNITRPYQIPFRIMLPLEVERLLVPVAASATHIAFSTVRMEPTWMALGQAAGTAAFLSLQLDCRVRDVPTDLLQRMLLREGQILTYFEDIVPTHPGHHAFQYFGAKGFFPDYKIRADEPVSRRRAVGWLAAALDARHTFGESDGDETGLDAYDQPFWFCVADLLETLGSGSEESLDTIVRQKLAEYGLPESNQDSGSRPLTRGEFCQFLYRLLEHSAPLPGPGTEAPSVQSTQ